MLINLSNLIELIELIELFELSELLDLVVGEVAGKKGGNPAFDTGLGSHVCQVSCPHVIEHRYGN